MKTGLVPRDEHEPGVRGEDRLQQRQDPELQTRRLYQKFQVGTKLKKLIVIVLIS